jgi:hypothetical protein
VIYLLT